MNLCEVSVGEVCQVREVVCGGALGDRLAALGISRRSRVQLLSVGPGGVRIVRVRGMRLALGRQTAAGIHVFRMEKASERGGKSFVP